MIEQQSQGLAISVANLAVLVVGGLILRSYLPSYLSEKGKNHASKEDLQHLTRPMVDDKFRLKVI